MAGFDVKSLKERAQTLSEGFTTKQKALIGGGTALAVIALLMFVRVANATEYATLYASISGEDAAAVVETLEGEGIPYRLSNGGATIAVPQDKLYKTRILMSAKPLPSQGGGEGWQNLDGMGITASDFSQQVGYQRALEAELAKTIRSIDGVEVATVHLALPRRTAFALQDAKASASVMIKTNGIGSLDPMQVQAIVNLVSSSVEKLDPADVTVADSTGVVLAAPGVRSGVGGSGDMNMRQAAEFESRIEKEITAMLGSVVGANHAVVRVSSELNFDEASVTKETYSNPRETADTEGEQPQLVLNDDVRTEKYTGETPMVGGILDLDGGQGGTGSGENRSYDLDEAARQYALNREVELINRAPGKIERMSVAVIVDSATTTPAMLEQIEDVVAVAAGIITDRGDTVVVSRMAFDTSAAEALEEEMAAAEAKASSQSQRELMQTLAMAAVVLLIVGVAWRNTAKARKRNRLAQSAGLEQLANYETVGLTVGDAAAGAGSNDDEFAPLDADELSELVGGLHHTPPPEAVRVATEVADMIDNQPEEVAQLLRGWMTEPRGGRR